MDDEEIVEVSKFWRLADSVNIVQAAFLINGTEPQGFEEYVETGPQTNAPKTMLQRETLLPVQ
jgi:hypothetical protein